MVQLTLAVPVAAAPVWSVPDTFTVQVYVPGDRPVALKLNVAEFPAANTVGPKLPVVAPLTVPETVRDVVPVLVTVPKKVIEEVDVTVQSMVTVSAAWMTVVDAWSLAVTVVAVWSVPETVTVLATDPGVSGAAKEPVQVVDWPAVSEDATQDRVPAWVSIAVMPDRVTSPLLVTVAVTMMVPPTSTLPEVALVTCIDGCMMVVEALAELVTVVGV